MADDLSSLDDEIRRSIVDQVTTGFPPQLAQGSANHSAQPPGQPVSGATPGPQGAAAPAAAPASSVPFAALDHAARPASARDETMSWYDGASVDTIAAQPSPSQRISNAASPMVPSASPATPSQQYQPPPVVVPAVTESSGPSIDARIISHTVRASAVRVPHLDKMLKALGMSRTGVKKVKQERLLFLAQQYYQSRNFRSLHHLRQVVEAYSPMGSGQAPPPSPSTIMRPMTYTESVNSIHPSSPPTPVSTAPNPLVANNSRRPSNAVHTPLSFQESPFYQLVAPLASPMFFIRPYTRRRVQQTSRFRVNSSVFADNRNRVFLMSQQFVPQAQDLRPLYFPFYIDISVDDQEVKANTRGVRGSVGSAKPVDLTQHLKSRPGYVRSVTVTIHVSDQNQYETVSDKSFAMGVYLAQKAPLEQLVSQIKERRHFTVEQTMKQLKDAAEDEDGITSSTMRCSLRDIVMRTRINQPIRSQLCDHIDCFDAESYFMLQDQAETWKCPVCNRKITFDSLLFDDYFMDILSKTPKEVDAVDVSPDGHWSVPAQEYESDSGESSDGDEHVSANKRARTEPAIEVVDLLSDTDEEVPERVQPIPSRGPIHPQHSQNQDRNEGQTQERSLPENGESENRVARHNRTIDDSESDSSQTDNATQPVNDSPQNDNNQTAATNGTASADKQTDSDGNRSETISHPASPPPPPPQPPEPRFQIAQMLQSFRASNSVLFQKPLPYPPGYHFLFGKNKNNEDESRSRSASGEMGSGATTPSPALNTNTASHYESQSQPQRPTTPADILSPLSNRPASLPNEEVIDLTGDD